MSLVCICTYVYHIYIVYMYIQKCVFYIYIHISMPVQLQCFAWRRIPTFMLQAKHTFRRNTFFSRKKLALTLTAESCCSRLVCGKCVNFKMTTIKPKRTWWAYTKAPICMLTCICTKLTPFELYSGEASWKEMHTCIHWNRHKSSLISHKSIITESVFAFLPCSDWGFGFECLLYVGKKFGLCLYIWRSVISPHLYRFLYLSYVAYSHPALPSDCLRQEACN